MKAIFTPVSLYFLTVESMYPWLLRAEGPGKTVQQVKAWTLKSDDLSLIPRTYFVQGEN